MKRIYEALLAESYPNSRVLAMELEVSPQTIKRDLEFMRDRWELPIAYDPRRYGFFILSQANTTTEVTVSEPSFALLLLR